MAFADDLVLLDESLVGLLDRINLTTAILRERATAVKNAKPNMVDLGLFRDGYHRRTVIDTSSTSNTSN